MESPAPPVHNTQTELEMSTHTYAALALIGALVACQPQQSSEAAVPQADEDLQMALAAFEPIPAEAGLDDLVLTPEKVELGKILFLDPRLSRSGLISCNTCHNLGMAGVDVQETSVGHGWQEGPRNAPTVLNAVFNVAQFWDGRAADLEEQAMGPVQATVEMNNTPNRVVTTLKSMPEYVAYFEAAFPGEADPVTFENMARAIEAFEATLITPGSRFDHFLEGDATALTDHEKQGLRLFVSNGCAACHNGVNVGGRSYHAFGVHHRPGADVLPPGDLGRYEVTGEESDQYVFRAPSLRNVELTPPYFHSGVVWDLNESVAIMGMAQLGAHLDLEETEAIVAFLKTLTGEQPEVDYPVLPARTDATPLPDVIMEPSAEDGEQTASGDAATRTAAAANPIAAAQSRMAMGGMRGRGMGTGSGMGAGGGMHAGRGMGAGGMGMGASGNCPMMSDDSTSARGMGAMGGARDGGMGAGRGMGAGGGMGMGGGQGMGGNCPMMSGEAAAADGDCPGGDCPVPEASR